ncbi:glycoside hydrolase family 28 protein [Pedobacter sp. WC2501]|uniref:glycoside hydrolase family 28 protein n=1 Tax=Pedobacter sp. WC2501 TaxID=3461400 RepID=UPI0040453CC3
MLENSSDQNLSRRQWLLKMPLAILGSFAATHTFAQFGNHKSILHHQIDLNSESNIYNVKSFGAKGDGRVLETNAIQAAIDTCFKNGGGTVLIPAGIYLCGSIELKSNLIFHLSSGAVILGSTNANDYHAVDAVPLSGDTTLRDGNWALFYATNAKNLVIEGNGTIDGQGASFHKSENGSSSQNVLWGEKRPHHFLGYHCESIKIKDVSFINCAYHSLRIIQSSRIDIQGVYIHSRVNVNNDGFHFISCKHVAISNSTVLCQDDACAFFGSCEAITVTNSTFSTRWSVFRFGGGKTKNITVSNCLLTKVYGCPIKFQGSPGSSLENASFSNLIFDDVTGPIYIACGFNPKDPNFDVRPGYPDTAKKAEVIVRNISFHNISGTVLSSPGQLPDLIGSVRVYPGEEFSCITLSSADNAIMDNISLTDINLTFGGGGSKEAGERRELPQSGGQYFSMGTMPAYALFVRSVNGLTLNNVKFNFFHDDERPAMIFDQVMDACIENVSLEAHINANSAIRIINCKDMLISSPRLTSSTITFLQVEGSENQNIRITGGDFSKSEIPIDMARGANATMIRRD